MQRYVIKRLLIAVPTIIGITLAAFILMYILPGDPVAILMGDVLDMRTMEMLREQLGLNDPLYVQYYRFISNALRRDFGKSYQTKRLVNDIISSALAYTGKLTLAAYIISIVVGIPAGVFAAVKHNSWGDTGTMVLSMLGICLPPFVVALLLLYVFAFRLAWFPLGGTGSFAHMILPAVTLGIRPAAMLARITRSGMLEVLRQDYVRTARAKGLSQRVVLTRHALKNCLIPVITVMGGQIGGLLSGSVVVESIFSWPGIGKVSVEAILARDFPVVQAVVLLSALVVVGINLLVDLSYAFVDPRIRYE
ncbi:MAG: ABC transporter permease [Firmicutes bacterium]|nr:ABC transporter permease [Bacillota bacterium]